MATEKSDLKQLMDGAEHAAEHVSDVAHDVADALHSAAHGSHMEHAGEPAHGAPHGDGEVTMSEAVEWVLHHVGDNDHYFAMGPVKLFNITVPFITLHYITLLIAIALMVFLFVFRFKRTTSTPTGRLTNFLECMVVFVRDEICIANMGPEDGRRLAPWFLNFFFFILLMNFMGLIPVFATVTANLTFTMAIACIPLFFMTIYAIYRNGIGGWFSAFVPHGIPWPILLIVTPLEIIGVFIKGGVLGLRLFANLLAGHIALFIMMSMIVVFGVIAAPMFGLVIFVYMLEMLVATLQAYIFTMLAALFVGQVLHPAH